MDFPDAFGDFSAEHPGHDDIGNQQMDVAVMTGGEGDGVRAVRGGGPCCHGQPALLQRAARVPAPPRSGSTVGGRER
jgi:hypothetical protein